MLRRLSPSGDRPSSALEGGPSIVRHFPEPCPPPGWPSFVLHGRTRALEYRERPGPLSLKCVFRGEDVHRVGRLRYVVEPERALLLNRGTPYATRIRSRDPVEVFSLFFGEGITAAARHELGRAAEDLLDEPRPACAQPLELFEGSLQPRGRLAETLGRIRRRSEAHSAEPQWLEERLHEVLADLVARDRGLARMAERLRAKRESTRREQLRRVLRARDFIEANLGRQLLLEEVAEVACLSSFHLLRLFREIYGRTPHRFASTRRVAVATKLLRDTELPVSEVGRRVGFECPAAFSHFVSRETGLAPSRLRRGQAPAGSQEQTSPRLGSGRTFD